jgi:hypothetical protein
VLSKIVTVHSFGIIETDQLNKMDLASQTQQVVYTESLDDSEIDASTSSTQELVQDGLENLLSPINSLSDTVSDPENKPTSRDYQVMPETSGDYLDTLDGEKWNSEQDYHSLDENVKEENIEDIYSGNLPSSANHSDGQDASLEDIEVMKVDVPAVPDENKSCSASSESEAGDEIEETLSNDSLSLVSDLEEQERILDDKDVLDEGADLKVFEEAASFDVQTFEDHSDEDVPSLVYDSDEQKGSLEDNDVWREDVLEALEKVDPDLEVHIGEDRNEEEYLEDKLHLTTDLGKQKEDPEEDKGFEANTPEVLPVDVCQEVDALSDSPKLEVAVLDGEKVNMEVSRMKEIVDAEVELEVAEKIPIEDPPVAAQMVKEQLQCVATAPAKKHSVKLLGLMRPVTRH